MRVHRRRRSRLCRTRRRVYFAKRRKQGVKPTAAAAAARVVLTFSEWPINFVYPPACIINARLPPPREKLPGVPQRPPARPALRRRVCPNRNNLLPH